MTVGSAPVPGWYDDPHAAGRLRWWDGSAWTEATHDMPPALADATPGEPLSSQSSVSAQTAQGNVTSDSSSHWGRQPGFAQQPGFGQQPSWAQRPEFAQQPGFDQQPGWAQQTGWAQQAAVDQSQGSATQPPYAQPGGFGPGATGGFGPPRGYGPQPPMGPSTGFSQASDASDAAADRQRLLLIIGGSAVAALVVLIVAYVLFFRSADPQADAAVAAGSPTVSDVEASAAAIQGGACQRLVGAMARNDLPIEMSVRLQELAKNENAAGNATYFASTASQLTPTRDSYQDACLADIASGKEPATVRTFVGAFDAAVDQGSSIGATIAAANSVDPAQAQALTDAATRLEQANAALPESVRSNTTNTSPAALAPQGTGKVIEAVLASYPLVAGPTAVVDPFAPPTAAGATAGATVQVDPFAAPVLVDTFPSLTPTPLPVVPSPRVPPVPNDSALAYQDNAKDAARTGTVPNATK